MSNIPDAQFGAVANIFIKMMHFNKAGDSEKGHTHVYDHVSLLAKGSVSIKVNDKVTQFTAPALVFIHADEKHEITALEDDTVWGCIHALRKGDGTGDIVSEDMIPAGVNTSHLISSLSKEGIIEVPVKEKLTPEEEEVLHAREQRSVVRGDIPIIDPTK